MAHRAGRGGTANDGRQYRRRGAGHLQGPLLSGTRSASLPRRHADRRAGRADRCDLYLPARRVCRLPRAADRGTAAAARGPAVRRSAADRIAARRRRLYLRRRVRDDRIDRRQARLAAAAAALCGAGRPVRPADAGAQLRDAVLGARHPGARRGVVRGAGPAWTQGIALVLGVGPRQQAGRASGTGRHHDHGADRRVLRRHARWPSFLRLSAGRRVGRHPARVDGRYPAGLRHAAAAWLLHRLGGGGGAVGP